MSDGVTVYILLCNIIDQYEQMFVDLRSRIHEESTKICCYFQALLRIAGVNVHLNSLAFN